MSRTNKIIFDSRWIGEHGIGRFANEIYDRLPGLTKIILKSKPSNPFDVLQITWYLFRHKGLYFSPGYNAPLLFLNRCIITIHDLNHIDTEHNTNILKKIYYEIVLKRACRRALKIFTVSEFSKNRICDWAKVDSSKIIVVGNGVSKEFSNNASRYSGKYFLVVGNRKKHKNEVIALEAFFHANLPDDVNILFTGNESEDLVKAVNRLGLTEKVKFLGKLDNNSLASLYKGAVALLFPSLYEGFGLPVIESMACGTPVITSNSTSLPEVSGDAALLVDPLDVNDISAAIKSIYYNIELRERLIQKGYKQVSNYSWEKTVKIIDNELKKLL
ncbi:glycosyltransferase family 1 protein [Klebsiella michiganensis]|uniref:glycosyltransferase family 4 protein n=1 Tax=Klebsiella michiganensis TaxID=1134687 RepID=UPI003B24CA95